MVGKQTRGSGFMSLRGRSKARGKILRQAQDDNDGGREKKERDGGGY